MFLFFIILTTQYGFGQGYTPTFAEAKKSLFKIKKDQKYTFGYLEVPENRSNPQSNTIRLPVYIFKCRKETAKKDPIIYTVGGPGYTTMTSAPYMGYYQYLDDRDFILFEQRGTYYAQPHLDCPEWANAIYQSNLPGFDEVLTDSLLAKAAADCRNRLVEKGIDLNGYHTREIAADIEDLRIALGIEQYNLLTISYSTKIAQVLMRDYPKGIRSVVMDSPLPLEVNYDEESVENLLAAIDQVLSDCELEPNCSAAYPNIKTRFFNYLQEKTVNPLEVAVENPNTGSVETFRLNGADLISVFTAASTGEVPLIPREIEKLLKNDLGTVKERLISLFEGPGYGSGMGMRLSVWCAEEYPFNTQEKIREETNRYPQTEGLSPAVFDSSICSIWSVVPQPQTENQAVESDIPVLLISGEYDNETPPKWAAAMRKNLKNSYHLIFKGWKHTPTTNWGNPCGMQVANAFFNNPGVEPVPDCFADIQGVQFEVE